MFVLLHHCLNLRSMYDLCITCLCICQPSDNTNIPDVSAAAFPPQVEVVVSSMGTTLASVGGFCVGHHEVCDHQRLCGQGYCFSASLPPYLATAAHQALNVLQTSRGQQLAAQVIYSFAVLAINLSGLNLNILSKP